MPHTNADTFSLHNVFVRNGESRFARPVAAITCHALALRDSIANAFTTHTAPVTPRIRQDMDVRALEEQLARAVDHGHVERLERAFDRREAEGVHIGDWR